MEELTDEEKKVAARLIEIISSGDTSDEAQEEYDRLMTPELRAKFGQGVLEIAQEREARDRAAAQERGQESAPERPPEEEER